LGWHIFENRGYSIPKAQQGEMANCGGLNSMIVLKLKVILPQKLF